MAALAVGAQRLGLSPEKVVELLGTTTFDIPLNDVALWANVPERVWRFNVSGYNVLKKWLSYRELTVLGRPLRVDEAREFTAIVQRIAALLLLGPALDASYRVVAGEAARWNDIVE